MEFADIDEDDIKAFLVETYESVEKIERDIIELEKNAGNEEIVTQMYRALHSIKGNCGFLPFPKLESIAHAGENLLGYLRDRHLVASPETISALLQTADAIRQILACIEAEGLEGNTDYSFIIESLTKLHDCQELVSQQVTQTSKPIPNIDSNNLQVTELALAESSIRVDVQLLDRLMDLVGELVLARNQLLELAQKQKNSSLTASCKAIDSITAQLQQEVMKTRMQPINSIFQKFPRAIRELEIACGKQVSLEIEGAETELDRSVIEAIKDPLTHIIRNCVDRGIETPQIRRESNKPERGKLFVRSWHQGGKVNIEIGDDGNGIDIERVKQKALQLGFINASQAETMSESEAINLIFLPGLSTAERVTNISGRGIGMNVVKNNIEQIDGKVEVCSKVGKGTTFKLKIPLTLAIIPALTVTSGNECFAIPQVSLQELVRLETQESQNSIEILYDAPVLRLRGEILPLLYLNRELQLQQMRDNDRENFGRPDSSLGKIQNPNDGVINIAVIQGDNYRYGLVVDRIEDIQEIVVKALGKQLRDLDVYSGATILGDGKVALILDPIALANRAGFNAQTYQQITTQEAEREELQLILLFEGPEGAPMGIPLSVASRLEKFSPNAVSKVGNQYVVRYRDTILSLVDLYSVFAGGERFSFHNSIFTEEEDDRLNVAIVSFDGQHNIGLIVDRLIDIVEDSLTVKGTASRPGVLFYAVVRGRVIEMLDLQYIIGKVNPHFLHLSGASISK